MLFLLAVGSFLCFSSCASSNRVFRVSNGKPAKIERFPYMAALELNDKHHCGAAIIGEDTLITAAHCYLNNSCPEQYQIRIGSRKREVGGQLFKVRHITKHQGYGLSDEEYLKYSNDIAIIWVISKITLSKVVQTVALPPEKSKLPITKLGYVTGWGRTSEKSKKSKELLYIKIPIWDRASCRVTLTKGKLSADMFCAGGLDNKRDACQGDSGGPLVVEGTLYGISSWGHGCGHKGIPGVYADVAYLRQWINSTLEAGPPSVEFNFCNSTIFE